MKNLFSFLVLVTVVSSYGCSKKTSTSIPAEHDQSALEASEDLFDHPEELTLYNPDHLNAEGIKKCALASFDTSCKVIESPFIGMGKDNITINDILEKTLSTRTSYLNTFKQALAKMPAKTLEMFGSVNSIVISERINPSFYSYGSGTIYLSAKYFWTTPEEKEKAILKQDYRASFGDSLAFSFTSDYVRNNKSLYESEKKEERSIEELAPILNRLLFHELSHANDFFPRSFYTSNTVDKNKTYYDFANERWNNKQLISQNLKTELTSTLLAKIGKIVYQGQAIEKADQDVTGLQVAEEFNLDSAADMYAYSSSREDLAMMVEKTFMYTNYYYANLAVVIKFPSANYEVPEDYDYPIAGGVINKMADNKVKIRTAEVLTRMFDARFSKDTIDQLAIVRPGFIREDASWQQVYKATRPAF